MDKIRFASPVSETNSEKTKDCNSNSHVEAHHSMHIKVKYHAKHMVNYQHQQQQCILYSPPYKNGIRYSNIQHSPSHYFSDSYTAMNCRPLQLRQQLPLPHNDGDVIWSKNYAKLNQKLLINTKDIFFNKNTCEISTIHNKLTTKLKKVLEKSEDLDKSSNSVCNAIRNSFKKSTDISKVKRANVELPKSQSLQRVNKDKKQNDSMQRKSGKTSHASSKVNNCKKETSDSSISINGHRHHSNSRYDCSKILEKQRKSRNSCKRQDAANNNAATQTANGQKCQGQGSSGFAVSNWLKNDMYCYERQLVPSCAEENTISYRKPADRNSTSSEAAGSDDDVCSTYTLQTKSSRKATKSRQKKQNKRKQLITSVNNNNTGTIAEPMDVDGVIKKYLKSNIGKQTITSAASNLRKQCTKAAALKAVLHNSKISKSPIVLSSCGSSSSVYNLLSSASSTTSLDSTTSSSTSSSPANSANSSPTASPTVNKRITEHLKKSTQTSVPPLRQFTKLNMNEQELIQQMRRYVIEPSLLRVYGFPVESEHHKGCIDIFKCLPKHLAEEAVTKDNQRHHCHFYGRKKCNILNVYDGLYSGSCSQDSGHGSGESSPRFTDSDASEMSEEDLITPIIAFYTPDGVYQVFSEYCNSVEKRCVRCSKMFQVNEKGQYLTFDSCTYHWGKLSNVYNGKCYVNVYSCCQGEELSEGCCQHPLHVWNGTVVGINGPYTDFVHTKHKKDKHRKHSKIYGIDCEMSYTGLGLEVTRVTVVGFDGSLVYDHFVRPQVDIIDYNTRFSGVSEKDLSIDSNNSIKTFAQVQEDLLNLFDADTILIGHGLDNDLRVLRLVHKTIIDTSVIFSHSTGFPYRRSLKNLTKSFLKRDIQCGDIGHSSFEDSRACLELMMWKVRKDLRHWSLQ